MESNTDLDINMKNFGKLCIEISLDLNITDNLDRTNRNGQIDQDICLVDKITDMSSDLV